MSLRVLAINPGAYFHIESLEGERLAHHFAKVVRPEELSDMRLEDFDALVFPCRSSAHRIVPHIDAISRFLDAGGTVAAAGETTLDQWLPGIRFQPQETNWWWWKEKGADLGVRIAQPDHRLFQRLERRDLTWHLHGWYEPPAGATTLATNADGGAILYVDEVSTNGRIIITSLDPFYHHGSHFMPAATRFLEGFLPWIAQELTPRDIGS